MKKIILVAGARPNFMKIAPIIRAMKAYSGLQPVLVHTGQHYDSNMSAVPELWDGKASERIAATLDR
jgi:UDP-N-acetylglucosamine 2-epimerase (non-hydrolysing)